MLRSHLLACVRETMLWPTAGKCVHGAKVCMRIREICIGDTLTDFVCLWFVSCFGALSSKAFSVTVLTIYLIWLS